MIADGTIVMTTEPNRDLRREWADEVWEKRQWGVKGKIIDHSYYHGPCYSVKHENGKVAWYDPSELRELFNIEVLNAGISFLVYNDPFFVFHSCTSNRDFRLHYIVSANLRIVVPISTRSLGALRIVSIEPRHTKQKRISPVAFPNLTYE